jgi:hypothetical protein
MSPLTVAMRLPGAAVAALGGVALAAFSSAAMAADAAHPAVVELFQSQGCSSCPPANANLLALADRPDILALSFQVTYWDNLGWKDTFGSPAYTARQWDYAHALKHRQVWTPQVVVNGRADTLGNRPGQIEQLVQRQDRGAEGPAITLGRGRVTVTGEVRRRPADVWLVRYDPKLVQVPIQRGENGGKTLPHRNVVRELVRLGAWSGATQTYDLPPASRTDLRTAVLVQSGPGGPILAAVRG